MGTSDSPEIDQIEPFETRDGSYTLVDRGRNLHYSSTHGAADEANHVFVQGTDLPSRPSPWRVLEFGFGGGVNFVETYRTARHGAEQQSLIYHGVEHRPVTPDTVDFHDGPAGLLVRKALDRIRSTDDTHVVVRDDANTTTLHLHAKRWQSFDVPNLTVDAVFFDPFGPGSQPEAWRTEAFEVAYEHLSESGRLATYSAATDVKRAMFRADFHVATAPGAGPKREMTVASPSADALEPLTLIDRSDFLDDES